MALLFNRQHNDFFDDKIELVRRSRKNLNLRVLPDGTVRVSAPRRAGQKEIIAFVQAHQRWIAQQRQMIHEAQKQRPCRFVSGEVILLWGRPLHLRIIEEDPCDQPRVFVEGDSLNVCVPFHTSVQQRKKAVENWQRSLINNSVIPLIDDWQEKIGVKVNKITLRTMKSCWGTCTAQTRRITINIALIEKPMTCLNYVVVHELCHLVHHNHSSDFWQLLTDHLPDWRETSRLLK
ncbi:MAG: M48 family metallopeptidase [Burkholderiales bacterium]|nr:M48 family metallopeptidase [Burkholderiales bacterium]